MKLSKEINAKIEVNIFHSSRVRERNIRKHLLKCGAKKVLMPSKKHKIEHIEHNRRFVNKKGILEGDVIFVPLEDGDRCEALKKNNKKVITVDLNPMSRTAKKSDITIVDNIVRTIPLMIKRVKFLRNKKLETILSNYDNNKILKKAKERIKKI